MDGQTDGWTDGRNFSPFYRTLSPIGAAAQKPAEMAKKVKIAKTHIETARRELKWHKTR